MYAHCVCYREKKCKHTGKLTKKPDQLCQLPATNLLPHASHCRKAIDTGCLLSKAMKRLEAVEREQYEMQLKAKLEFCKKGALLSELDKLEWYDYSKCKKSIFDYSLL